MTISDVMYICVFLSYMRELCLSNSEFTWKGQNYRKLGEQQERNRNIKKRDRGKKNWHEDELIFEKFMQLHRLRGVIGNSGY